MLQELILNVLLDTPRDDGLDLDALAQRTGFSTEIVARHLAELTERGYLVHEPVPAPPRWRAVRHPAQAGTE